MKDVLAWIWIGLTLVGVGWGFYFLARETATAWREWRDS